MANKKKIKSRHVGKKSSSQIKKPAVNITLSPLAGRYIYILLCLVTLSAFILRFLYFNQNPPALNQDEAMNGYNAFSLSKTLRDSRGVFLPSLMHGLGNVDFRSPLYAYLSVPFMWMIGLSDTSARMAGLVFNVALIPIVFILVNKMFNNKILALLSAALLTMNPWHFHYSRIGHEAVISPFFYFLSILLLYMALKDNKHNRLFPLVGIAFGVSMYSYQVARVLSPMIFVFICVIYHKEARGKIKQLLIAAVTSLIVLFPMIYSSLIKPGDLESRFAQVSIFSKPDAIKNLITNYFTHFSPGFLFLTGDSADLPGMAGRQGMLEIYLIPLLIIGIMYLIYTFIKNADYKREILLVFGFLLLYPLPAAVTFPAPHALRAYTLVPVFHIISAAGVWYIVKSINLARLDLRLKIASYVIMAVPVVFIFQNFLVSYYFIYPKYAENYYQYGMKEVVEYIGQNQDKYDKIYITSKFNQPFIYVLFYTKYDPAKYQKVGKKADYRGFGTVYYFDRYYFIDDAEMPFDQKNCLFVTREYMDQAGRKLVKTINNSSNYPVFFIWE